MTDDPLTIAAFQRHVRDRYYATDAARGTPRTFLWFVEEVGELATALNAEPRDRANLEGIDLAEAVRRKYLSDRPPEGTK